MMMGVTSEHQYLIQAVSVMASHIESSVIQSFLASLGFPEKVL